MSTGSGSDDRQRILRLMRGYRSAHVLISCADLGVFEALRGGSAGAEKLAQHLGAHAGSLVRLLNAAVALDLLEKRGEEYANSRAAATCLAEEGPFYLGNMVKREGAFFRRWSRLTEAVRVGERPDDNRVDERDESWVRDFELALYDAARTAAPAVAEALAPLLPREAGRRIRVLDAGGGHGAYSVALARRVPAVEAIVFDLPAVIAVVGDLVETPEVGGRVRLQAGDFRTDELGADFDLVLLFGILVSETPADALALLRKVHAALVPGGLVAIRGFYLDADRTGPPESALFDLHMLLSTGAGAAHTVDAVTAWLAEAGFQPPETIALPAPEQSNVLVARNPVG